MWQEKERQARLRFLSSALHGLEFHLSQASTDSFKDLTNTSASPLPSARQLNWTRRSPSSAPFTMTKHLTEDEAALYDRQLRLWGVEAQNRMLGSNLLVVGFRGVAAEVLKNTILAGVGAITMLDAEDVMEQDLGSNYFLREEDVGLKVSSPSPSFPKRRADPR